MRESEYTQHMKKYLELMMLSVAALDKAASALGRQAEPGVMSKRQLEDEAIALEDKIVALEQMLST